MKILVSPKCLDEAQLLVELGVDIIDIKNPLEGSLGAAVPHVIRDIACYCRSRAVPTSATLGDLPFQPGTAALAAFGLAHLRVSYIKVGLHGARNEEQAIQMLGAVGDAIAMVDSSIAIVAAGYADHRLFDGLSPGELLRAAVHTGCPAIMLDTADKRHGSLFDAMAEPELRSFVVAARQARLLVGLAGSIDARHLPALADLQPDIVGVRGALCTKHDRTQHIDAGSVRRFVTTLRVGRLQTAW